jgi:crotonobetainyl-CoA:carnitine CoA-transferase CaiB-like acyl-CoA transferase
MIVPYGAYPTADGRLMIAAANDGLFRRLCAALALPDLAADQRYRSNPDRVAHRQALNEAIGAATVGWTTDALLQLLRQAGVPCAPIQDVAGVARDPQTAASGMVQDQDGEPALALPIRRAGVRNPVGGAAPAAGEHTAELLDELDGTVDGRAGALRP